MAETKDEERTEGSVHYRACSFGPAVARLADLPLKAVFHVADLEKAVTVAGSSEGLDEPLDLYVCKLIMGSLEDEDLEAVKQHADLLLGSSVRGP